MVFVVPVADNDEGWGPVMLPEQVKEIYTVAYAPFNKGEKLGRAADWTQNQRGRQRQFDAGGANVFGYRYVDDDDSFAVVDRGAPKPKYYGNRRFQRNNQRFVQRRTIQQQQSLTKHKKQNWQKPRSRWDRLGGGRYQRNYYDNRDKIIKRDSSLEVKADWVVHDEMDTPALSKLQCAEPPEPQTLVTCGELEYYNTAYDSINTQREKQLQRIERTFFRVKASHDPIMQQLSEDGVGNVYATDTILALLMACPRSSYSWDVVVTRVGNKLWFDKRDSSSFDFLTVNENSHEPPSDQATETNNTPAALAQEATFINQNFSQQVLKKGPNDSTHKLEKPHPFQTPGEEVAATGYRYRKWQVSPTITLVARCELDAVLLDKGVEHYISIKAMNEYDPKLGVDWRKKLDSQRGAVLATELKNNSNKLAKWLIQAQLAGAEFIKLGYVTRMQPKDSYSHVILGTQMYRTNEFAKQINLSGKNMWGIFKHICDACMKLPEGKYVLLRDPNRPVVRLYSVPPETFEEAEEGDEEEEGAAAAQAGKP